MAAGRPADTPVALVRWGTTPNQEVLTATLATVADEAARVNFKAPAIIVVGEVARLRDSIAWFDQRPLFGKTVVVTRSREQASALSERLAAAGANVVEFPTIAIEPRPLSDEMQQAVKKLAEGAFAWVVFTSANGVTCFFERLAELGRDSRTFAGAKVCAIGPATAAALASHGITADVLPKRFVAESVLEALFAHGLTAGQAVLIPRAAKARDVLPRTLAERGVDACVLPVYDTVIPSRDDQTANLAELFRTGSIDAITFTSSSTASNFATLMGKELEDGELPGLLQGVTCASIGPVTSGTMVAHGIPVSIQATEYTIPALADAVIGTLQAHPAEEPTTAPSVPCQPTEERNQLA
jgi:uroporphyrinogen III methyltransferase/synthase